MPETTVQPAPPVYPGVYLYEQVDYRHGRYGEHIWDNDALNEGPDCVNCAGCGKTIGDVLGYDEETGHDTAGGTVDPYLGPAGLVCEDCAVALDPELAAFIATPEFQAWLDTAAAWLARDFRTEFPTESTTR
jgi:hypothetical protein